MSWGAGGSTRRGRGMGVCAVFGSGESKGVSTVSSVASRQPLPLSHPQILILRCQGLKEPQGSLCFLTAHFIDEETEAQCFHAFPDLAESFLCVYCHFSFCLRPLRAGKFFFMSSLDLFGCSFFSLWSNNASLLLPIPTVSAPLAWGTGEKLGEKGALPARLPVGSVPSRGISSSFQRQDVGAVGFFPPPFGETKGSLLLLLMYFCSSLNKKLWFLKGSIQRKPHMSLD